jgi:hypothetical protein
MQVFATETEDGVATMTISIADDDHKFDLWKEGDKALVEYQETRQHWRGQIRVSEPDEDIYKALMVSDEMTRLLDQWDVNSVKRAVPTP